MNKLSLSLATLPYDHIADLVTGRVIPEGIALTYLGLSYHDILLRGVMFHDFDVHEISMAKYTSMRAGGDDSLIAIPVFPNRVPRHSSIYVRSDGVKRPQDLAGCRVGVPEWVQTAAVYARGLLSGYYGVDLHSIDWVQAGADQPGRTEKVALHLPEGLRLTPIADKSLNDMLLAGELDAVIAALPPQCYRDGRPEVRRLFEDYIEEEQKYVRTTGIFPIMHTIVIRKAILDRTPWVAANLYAAFEEAKRNSVERAFIPGASMFPVPWVPEYARRAMEIVGPDIFPYGVEPNRKTLEAFLDFMSEQGIITHRPRIEDLFAPQTQVHALI